MEETNIFSTVYSCRSINENSNSLLAASAQCPQIKDRAHEDVHPTFPLYLRFLLGKGRGTIINDFAVLLEQIFDLIVTTIHSPLALTNISNRETVSR